MLGIFVFFLFFPRKYCSVNLQVNYYWKPKKKFFKVIWFYSCLSVALFLIIIFQGCRIFPWNLNMHKICLYLPIQQAGSSNLPLIEPCVPRWTNHDHVWYFWTGLAITDIQTNRLISFDRIVINILRSFWYKTDLYLFCLSRKYIMYCKSPCNTRKQLW